MTDSGRKPEETVKRGDTFKLTWLKDICTVTATRKGTLYFRSGDDKYQMPLETYEMHVATAKEKP